jgi:hypothetical protein
MDVVPARKAQERQTKGINVKIHAKGMEGERLRVTEGQEERTQER